MIDFKKKHPRHDRIFDTLSRMAISIETFGNARVASCITIQNKIVAFGYNQAKTNPLQFRFKKNDESIYLHAEIDAIRNSLRFVNIDDLNRATLYICRVRCNPNDHSKFEFGLAKPCRNGCARAIEHFNFKNVIYSTDDNSYEIVRRT